MSHFQDLTGNTYNDLTVISYEGRPNGTTLWRCVCKCGTFTTVSSSHLKWGGVKSCGCRKHQPPPNKRHGMTRSPEHNTFLKIKSRTGNPNNIGYRDYGGRGIKCLYESFDAFFADVGPKPSPRHSIDRIDNDGNYEPGNCRWATPVEQARNKRNTAKILKGTDEVSLIDAAEQAGLKRATVSYRVLYGKSETDPLRPLRAPKMVTWRGETASLWEWSKRTGIDADTLSWRIKNGWRLDDAFTVLPSRRTKKSFCHKRGENV